MKEEEKQGYDLTLYGEVFLKIKDRLGLDWRELSREVGVSHTYFRSVVKKYSGGGNKPNTQAQTKLETYLKSKGATVEELNELRLSLDTIRKLSLKKRNERRNETGKYLMSLLSKHHLPVVAFIHEAGLSSSYFYNHIREGVGTFNVKEMSKIINCLRKKEIAENELKELIDIWEIQQRNQKKTRKSRHGNIQNLNRLGQVLLREVEHLNIPLRGLCEETKLNRSLFYHYCRYQTTTFSKSLIEKIIHYMKERGLSEESARQIRYNWFITRGKVDLKDLDEEKQYFLAEVMDFLTTSELSEEERVVKIAELRKMMQ